MPGMLVRLDPVSDALVGGEHELFDQTVRPASFRAHDGLHVAFGIELHDGSGRSKSMEPRRLRLALSLSARSCIRSNSGASCANCSARRFVAVEDCLDLRVGHAPCAADDSFAYLEADDLAARVDLHDAAQDEAVFIGAQAAHAARELVAAAWEWRGRGSRQRCRAVALRDRARCRAGRTGYIGDVDLQLPVSVRQSANVDGIVEVACRLAVDGDDGESAEVAAFRGLCRYRACRPSALQSRWPRPAHSAGRCGADGACG